MVGPFALWRNKCHHHEVTPRHDVTRVDAPGAPVIREGNKQPCVSRKTQSLVPISCRAKSRPASDGGEDAVGSYVVRGTSLHPPAIGQISASRSQSGLGAPQALPMDHFFVSAVVRLNATTQPGQTYLWKLTACGAATWVGCLRAPSHTSDSALFASLPRDRGRMKRSRLFYAYTKQIPLDVAFWRNSTLYEVEGSPNFTTWQGSDTASARRTRNGAPSTTFERSPQRTGCRSVTYRQHMTWRREKGRWS